MVGVALRPLPVAEKGSKALFEITSKRQYIYVQRIATVFQTGRYHPPARRAAVSNLRKQFDKEINLMTENNCTKFILFLILKIQQSHC